MGKRKVDKGKVCNAAYNCLDHLSGENYLYGDNCFDGEGLDKEESKLALDIIDDILSCNGVPMREVERTFDRLASGKDITSKSSVKDACAESVGQAHARLRHAAINWPGKKLRTRAHFLCDKLEDLSKAMGHPFPKTN